VIAGQPPHITTDSTLSRSPAPAYDSQPRCRTYGFVYHRTPGPRPLRIPVGAEAGLSGHRESYVDTTSVFTVSRAQLRRRRGRLSPSEIAAVEHSLATMIGLDLADPD